MREMLKNLSNYFYILIKLGVKISFKDVKELRHFFEPTEDDEFSPLEYIRDLPKERRRGALLAGARIIKSARMMSGDRDKET
jgi:hypothetical protein